MAAITLAGLISSAPASSASLSTKCDWLADCQLYAEAKDYKTILADSRAGLLYSKQEEVLNNMIQVTLSELKSVQKGVSES